MKSYSTMIYWNKFRFSGDWILWIIMWWIIVKLTFVIYNSPEVCENRVVALIRTGRAMPEDAKKGAEAGGSGGRKAYVNPHGSSGSGWIGGEVAAERCRHFLNCSELRNASLCRSARHHAEALFRNRSRTVVRILIYCEVKFRVFLKGNLVVTKSWQYFLELKEFIIDNPRRSKQE